MLILFELSVVRFFTGFFGRSHFQVAVSLWHHDNLLS